MYGRGRIRVVFYDYLFNDVLAGDIDCCDLLFLLLSVYQETLQVLFVSLSCYYPFILYVQSLNYRFDELLA